MANVLPTVKVQMTREVPDLRAARRFRRLLTHLGVDAATFAAETGINRSYVTKLEKGTRLGSGASVVERTRRRYQIAPRYWTSAEDLDPAECIDGVAQDARPPRLVLIESAAKRGETSIIVDLATARPPDGHENDWQWWTLLYGDLRAQNR